LIRIYLIWDILPLPMHMSRIFHGKETWAKQIEEVAGERPVVFMNKYQYPSVYWFYTGKKAFTRNNLLYRRNQYDVWPLESELEGQNVLLTRWGAPDSSKVLSTVFGDIHYYDIERYCSFNRLKIEIPEEKPESMAGESFEVAVRISNPTSLEVSLDCDCDLPPLLMYAYINEDRKTRFYTVEPQPVFGSIGLGSLEPGGEFLLDVRLIAPAEPGRYALTISFGSRILLPGINGAPVELKISPASQEKSLAQK
ncbi:MAG: hypothetical protein KAT15_16245, partial [Bacteroidales bacterium]|nr:hypothetical protein [Bacteroidales bacterium]